MEWPLMEHRKQHWPKRAASQTGPVLGCFDGQLRIRRDLFDEAVTICDIEAPETPVVRPGDAEALQLGDATVELSGLLGWLTPFADQSGHTYYIHHHDNIVAEVALFDPYERVVFGRRLRLFRASPADEGGSNLLGVADQGRAWVLVIENDNQGRFRIEFLGPAEMCQSLRSHLKTTTN
ncbi:hypothetical protein [Zavarzinella formosa]|uniref:hypothetical protein n=1 Tax=Zavarzinella formosa TaxID=360055 RepID=UPI000495FC65|nr:hypothetical protein [Zavarzinella formosa]